MKRDLCYLSIPLILLSLAGNGKDNPTRVFRFYEDNDFLNIRGKGTDKAYSNGVRFDIYYKGDAYRRNIIDRLFPKAGKGSVNSYGWSLMQMMVTPSNLTIPTYQKDDYPYSGVLFASHSMASFNAEKQWMLQTEVVAGIRGPASFAKQTQVWIHRLINDEKPMGWKNQCETKILLNINFTAEKLLFNPKKGIELIGGTAISAGSMSNALTVYPLVRIGLMNPYFNGFFSQFGARRLADGQTRKMQIYFIVKPKITFLATNAVMSGKIEKSTNSVESLQEDYSCKVNHYLAEMDFGVVIVRGNASISYTQKPTTAYNKGLYNHNVGNISLYFSW